MRTRLFWVLVCVLVLLNASTLKADHGGGGTAQVTLGQSILERLSKPSTNVYFNFEYNDLDSGGGYTALYQLLGEYAFFDRYSIGGRIPVWTAENNFAPNNTKIGDVALMFRASAWQSENWGMNLLTGLDLAFPTGNDQVSLGAGVVTFTPFVTLGKAFDRVNVFLSIMGSFEADAVVNPTLAYEAGVLVKVLKGRVPLSFFLSFQGFTFVVSDTFNQGDTKAFVVPGLVMEFGEHWEWGVSSRISVIDTLSFLSTVQFNDFVTGLYTDINVGVISNLGYKF